ncbi:MAG TPA: hypothetical protein VG433_10245 [Pirellulales bacterium]|nr:hypothetical protein [Pirellulales bacterium]
MAMHHSGGAQRTWTDYMPWSYTAWIMLILIVIAILVTIAGYGWRAGGNQQQAQQMIQGEQPVQADAQAGQPGGPAPANQAENPLAR